MRHSFIIYIGGIVFALLSSLLCTSCITSEDFEDSHCGNFEALWTVLDEHYCFFDYKAKEYGLDWNEVHSRYAAQVHDSLSTDALFQILSSMTYELRDGHCNLVAPHDVASYTQWYDAFPMNFSDSLQVKYIGKKADYRTTCGMKYRVMKNNIGYVRVPTFDVGIGDGNLHEIFMYLATCDALIIDVRSNGGGLLTTAQTLAGAFVNETTTCGFMTHKTGRGHSDFAEPKPMKVTPAKGLRWQKPVVVLTNRRTYSAANAFVMFMHALGATTIGDRTGGGSGMPFTSELPEGWAVRFSACPMTDIEGRDTEFGIEPDVHVDITPDDYQRSVDTILEYALDYLAQSVREPQH